MQEIIDRIAASDPDFRATLATGLDRPPFEIAETEPIVVTLDRIAAARTGKPVPRRGEPFWTDCAILQGAGTPCVMFGADGAGAHAASEWVDMASVGTLTDILTETAAAFCG